jgi:hypothetical protein
MTKDNASAAPAIECRHKFSQKRFIIPDSYFYGTLFNDARHG